MRGFVGHVRETKHRGGVAACHEGKWRGEVREKGEWKRVR